MTNADISLDPGTRLGPYEVVGKLGVGGMGVVFLGHDPRLQRRVALKCITAVETQPGQMRARVLREARAAARLNHPNIAGVYDVLEQDGRTFIVMEYVEGESLSARLVRERMSIDAVRRVGRQLAAALAAAHSHGVIHRDLKPANIHIGHDGSIKVLDFGVAKLSPARAAGPEAPTEDAVVESTLAGNPGTLVYMSPEQLLGKKVDARTDIYSAGVILFEMATGRRPFQANDAVALAVAISAGAAPSATSLNPDVPPDLSETIGRALERDPRRRFQSAREFEDALASDGAPATCAVTEREATTRAGGRPDRMLPWWRRLVMPIAVLVAFAAGGVVARERLRVWLGLGGLVAPPASIVLAIMPVDTPSGEAQAEYLGAGMTSVIAGNFGSISHILVLSRAATAPYQKNFDDFAALQRALGATHVLNLSLRAVEPTPELTARLYRPDVPQPLWDETFRGDALAIERNMLVGLGRTLERGKPARQFTAAEWNRLRKLPTTSGAALMAQSEARALLDRPVPEVDRAVALLQQATTVDPQFVFAWAGLGDAWWNKYQRDKDPAQATKATEALRRAIAIEPDNASVYYALGDMQYRTGQPAQAEASFRRALQLQPDSDAAQRGLAQVLAGSGRTDEAEALLHQSIRFSKNWNNFFMLGTVDYRAGRYQAAVDAFKQATEATPNNAAAFTMLGTSQYVLGDLQQALGNFEHAVRLGPTPAAYANVALAYYDSGRFEDALHAYEQALQRDPRGMVNHRNIGDVYQRLGRAREARTEYERAIELGNALLSVNPRDVRTIALVALCEAKLGRRTNAERHSAEAVALDSTSREAWQRSAEVHALLNQREAALRDLAIAVARGFEPRMARTDDELASLRRLPRFEEILKNSPGNPAKRQGARS